MAIVGNGHQNWGAGHRSESTEQLDRLLAGLDELNGNLPGLQNGKTSRGAIDLPTNYENTQHSRGQDLQKGGHCPSYTHKRKQSNGESVWRASIFGVSNNIRAVSVSMLHINCTRTREMRAKVQPQPLKSGNSYEEKLDCVWERDADMREKISDRPRYSLKGHEPLPYHSKLFSYIR